MSDLRQNTVAFTRDEMLPAQTPPVSQTGLGGWARKNLFDGVGNSALSIISGLFMLWILWMILDWALFNSVVNAGSLSECRSIIKASYGEGAHGACWSVIGERFWQLIYGFYPPEHYWRVNLSFVLMLVALAPVLFSGFPRILMLFTAIYPAIAYWLLWGGSIWGPIMVLAGFVLGILAFAILSRILNNLVAIIAFFLVPILWWFFGMDTAIDMADAQWPMMLEEVKTAKFGGFTISVIIGVTGIAGSLPLGILLALGRQSNLFIVRTLAIGFIEFIRGVPLITLLFVASTLLNYFLPPGTNFDLVLRVVIMVTLFASAYMAEVIRGGLAAVPRGQYEAADALGLDYWKAQRLVIMPQALKISIPAIVSTFIGLFKDTTLISIIGLFDPIGLSNAIRADTNWNGIVWELYAFIAFMFFIFCFSMSRYSMYLERKLNTGHR